MYPLISSCSCVHASYYMSIPVLLLFIRPVLSDSLQAHELQHTRPPYPSPSQNLPKFMSIALVMPSSHRILWHPLLPSIFPSIRAFSNESAVCIRWPKYWSFNFSISPSNEYSGLVSLKIDCFDLLGMQGTLRSLLQHHSLKASILWHSDFFMVQLSHPYITTGKTITLTTQTFVAKVVSCFLIHCPGLSELFLPRSKHILISWLQSLSTVILEPKTIKSVTAFTFSHLFAMKWCDWTPWS